MNIIKIRVQLQHISYTCINCDLFNVMNQENWTRNYDNELNSATIMEALTPDLEFNFNHACFQATVKGIMKKFMNYGRHDYSVSFDYLQSSKVDGSCL